METFSVVEMEKIIIGRKLYLDGLKGIACLFIMNGHFTGIYKYATNSTSIDCCFLKAFTVFPFSLLAAESFWLYLFFAISGYLLASTNVRSFYDVLRKSVVRFLRFLIPVAGAFIFVFLFENTMGFHTQELKQYIDNSWLFLSFQRSFSNRDLLLEPIKVFVFGNSIFDSPLWVMRYMFVTSVFIYLINFMLNKGDNATNKLGLLFLISILLASIFLKKMVVFGCLCGACAKYFDDYLSRLVKNKVVVVIVYCALLSAYFINNLFATAIVFSLWIVTLDRSNVAKALENTLPVGLGKISLGIFVLHWPVYNSVGMLMILDMFGKIDNSILFIIVFSITVTIVLICSVVFKMTIEQLASYVCNLVDNRIKLLCTRGEAR